MRRSNPLIKLEIASLHLVIRNDESSYVHSTSSPS